MLTKYKAVEEAHARTHASLNVNTYIQYGTQKLHTHIFTKSMRAAGLRWPPFEIQLSGLQLLTWFLPLLMDLDKLKNV